MADTRTILDTRGVDRLLTAMLEWPREIRVAGVRALVRAGSDIRQETHHYNLQLWGELTRMRPVLATARAYELAESGRGEPVVRLLKQTNRQQSRIVEKHMRAARRNIDLLGAWRREGGVGARRWLNVGGRRRVQYAPAIGGSGR